MSDTRYVVLPDDLVKIEKDDAGHLQFVRNPKEEVKPVEVGVVYPHTERLQAKHKAEMEAGKKRIAAAVEQRKNNPPPAKSAAEVQAEGSTVPVFRPGDFKEYAKNFKSQAAAKSKDA